MLASSSVLALVMMGAPEPEPVPTATWVEPTRQPEAKPEGPEPAPTTGVAPENRRLIIPGNVLIGVGVGTFLSMTVGFLVASDARDHLGFARGQEDEDAIAKFEQRERTGNIIGIASGATTVALLITGITLTAVGGSRERKRRAALEKTSFVPLLAPGGGGLSWVGRF